MPVIVFSLAEVRCVHGSQMGVGPSFEGFMPLPAIGLCLSGVTRDSSGAALGGCTVMLFRTADNLLMETAVSDGSGNYKFKTIGPSEQYYAVAYLGGSPDVAGTTVNTLTGS